MEPGINLDQFKKSRQVASIKNHYEKKSEPNFSVNWKKILTTEIKFPGTTLLKDKTREEFYLELGILLEAGVDIKSALELIVDEQSKPALKNLFSEINNQIISGKTFSDAIKNTNEFSAYEFFSLQIGEESGKITLVLKELAGFYTKKIKQQRQIMSALSYPIVVLCTAFGAVFFMISFVVPMFSGIFKRFGGDLPFITKLVLKASDFLKATLPYFIIIIISLIMFFVSQRNKIWYKKISAQILLKIPLVGSLLQKVYLARFSYSMTLLIGSRVPILRSIGMVKQMIAFYPIESSLENIENQILQGIPLHKGMACHSIYPKRMVSLVKVGEEVNQLELFFDKIAKQYNDEVEYQTALISSVIEPIIIIFLGLIVGTILISMYLPLFKLGSTF